MFMRHSSGDISPVLRNVAAPALFTRMSSAPNSRSTASKKAATCGHLCDVGGLPEHFAERRHLANSGIDGFPASAADRNRGAFAQEPLRDGASDAARAAGHDRIFSGERFHMCLFCGSAREHVDREPPYLDAGTLAIHRELAPPILEELKERGVGPQRKPCVASPDLMKPVVRITDEFGSPAAMGMVELWYADL